MWAARFNTLTYHIVASPARCHISLRRRPLAGLATRRASGRLWTMYKTVRNKLHAPTPLYVTPHAYDTPERGDRPSLAL